jgi:hypothetical protein
MAEASRVGSRPRRYALRRALLPELAEYQTPLWRISHTCLYIRSHWLRMPPLPLARHLLHKAWVCRFAAAAS